MHKLIKKYQWGGTASPSSIGQSIQSKDLGIIKQQADLNLRNSLQLPSTSIIGKSNKTNINNTANIAGGIADIVSNLIPSKEQSALTTGLNQGYDTVANTAMSIPGVGTVIGGAMKVGGMLSDGLTALGVGTDQMTTTDKILDSKFLKLTPVGLINSIGASKADTMYKDNQTWAQQGDAYGGSLTNVNNAMTKSGKKYGLFSGKGRRTANDQIAEAKRQQDAVQKINNKAQDDFLAANNSGFIGLKNQINLNGVNWNKIHVAKSGLKLDREFAKRVINLSKNKKEKIKKIQEKVRAEEVAGFKNGGAVNVIPDGALHKNKHHLETVDERFEDVTAKGIPVITESKGGDITQHAEVEREEIIFNLEVTKQLEKLMEDGSESAAIEAGKLLVHEILENTVDNTGILNKI